MELDEQIYVNVEELRDIRSTYHRGSEKTESSPLGTGAVAGEETQTCSSFKVATVCLGLLGFLLLAAVAGVSVLYVKDVNQLSRELANHTADKQQLLARYQNLTDERDKLQTSFKKASGTCPSGWKKFGCSCYFLSPTVSTWTDSRQRCLFQGADLVVINSWGEMVFLNQLGAYLKFWIGLSQSTSQTPWSWTDGRLLSTSYWQYGQPSGYSIRTQRCAAFNSFQAGRSWSSEHCYQYLQWVCEKEAEILI